MFTSSGGQIFVAIIRSRCSCSLTDYSAKLFASLVGRTQSIMNRIV